MLEAETEAKILALTSLIGPYQQCRLIQWRARAQGPQASGGPKQPMR